jgi:hypothetical protein
MTNLSSPAAEPAAVFSNTMPDIIDSLKRLERIGSESSKTVAKIIAAAREAEAKIVDQYAWRSKPVQIDPRSILGRRAAKEGLTLEEVARTLGVPCKREEYFPDEFPQYQIGLPSYEISKNSAGSNRLYRSNGTEWVGENRDTALNFAKDLSDGLLALIAEDLSYQQRENEEALAILERGNPNQQGAQPVQRAVRVQAPSRQFVAFVELTFAVSPGDSLPDHMQGEFVNFGDDPLNELAAQDEDVVMWLNALDGYRLTMPGPPGSAKFSLEHQRINPVSGRKGFPQG